MVYYCPGIRNANILILADLISVSFLKLTHLPSDASMSLNASADRKYRK